MNQSHPTHDSTVGSDSTKMVPVKATTPMKVTVSKPRKSYLNSPGNTTKLLHTLGMTSSPTTTPSILIEDVSSTQTELIQVIDFNQDVTSDQKKPPKPPKRPSHHNIRSSPKEARFEEELDGRSSSVGHPPRLNSGYPPRLNSGYPPRLSSGYLSQERRSFPNLKHESRDSEHLSIPVTSLHHSMLELRQSGGTGYPSFSPFNWQGRGQRHRCNSGGPDSRLLVGDFRTPCHWCPGVQTGSSLSRSSVSRSGEGLVSPTDEELLFIKSVSPCQSPSDVRGEGGEEGGWGGEVEEEGEEGGCVCGVDVSQGCQIKAQSEPVWPHMCRVI